MTEQEIADALADAVKWNGLTVEQAAASVALARGSDLTIREVQAAMKARPDVFPPKISYRRLTR